MQVYCVKPDFCGGINVTNGFEMLNGNIMPTQRYNIEFCAVLSEVVADRAEKRRMNYLDTLAC